MNAKKLRRGILAGSTVILAAVVTNGCGETQSDHMSESKIIGGTEVPTNQQDSIFWSTVALTTDSVRPNSTDTSTLIDKAQSFCSGTIINKRTILTAAHCLQKFDPNTRQRLPDLVLDSHEHFLVFFGNKVARSGTWVRAKKVIPHPDWSPSETLSPSPTNAAHDIGLVILADDIPSTHRPVKLADQNTRLDSDSSQIHLAGFGVSFSRNQNDTGTLRTVVTNLSKEEGNIRRFTVGQFFRGACAGDSGGPAYVKVNGEFQAVGATSTGAEILGVCLGLINNYTDARFYHDWIEEVATDESGLPLPL